MAPRVRQPSWDIDRRGALLRTKAGGWTHERHEPCNLIVLHGTVSNDFPGIVDIRGVMDYWASPAAGGMAHVVVDREANTGYAVDIGRTAPHVGSPENGNSVGIEIVSMEHLWDKLSYWTARSKQLHEVARVMAWMMHVYPVIRPRVASFAKNGDVLRPGVTTHRRLSDLGLSTGHTDPGPAFPLATVISMAGWYLDHGWEDGVFTGVVPGKLP